MAEIVSFSVDVAASVAYLLHIKLVLPRASSLGIHFSRNKSRITSPRLHVLGHSTKKEDEKDQLMLGFEPTTSGLQEMCSTVAMPAAVAAIAPLF